MPELRSFTSQRLGGRAKEGCLLSKTRTIKIFSDGAARGNPGHAGAGAVLEDEDGNVIAEVSEYLGIKTNNAAEYTALILALERAREFGDCRLELRLDSQLVVEQLRGNYKVKSADLRPLYEKAKSLMRTFACIDVQHVYRSENAKADKLANRGIDERSSNAPVQSPTKEKIIRQPEQGSLF